MNDTQYLLRYEEQLMQTLLEKCTSQKFLDGQLLEVEELNEKWSEMAPEYMVDAVPEVQAFPAVAISWAAYIGMGMAAMWDGAWEEHSSKMDLYTHFRAPRGFDELDEYVVQECLGLEPDSAQSKALADLLCGCAHSAMALMRNEKIEPQSTDAFYIFTHTAKVFFRLGVALELKQLGYKYEKIKVQLPEESSN